MLYNQPKIPLKNCASCRDRACPARSLPPYPFYDSIRRGGINPSRAPSHRRKRPRRPEGWPPYTPTSNPCVGRGALTPPKLTATSRFPHRRPVGAGYARPAAYRQIPFTINPQGRDLSLPHTFPPPQTAAAARGLAALRPHLKPVRRAGCPHPAETCRPLHAPSVHFPKFIHFFVKKSTQKIFFVL